jgi:pimeloyl-ACP methyl ester carboxylesterase
MSIETVRSKDNTTIGYERSGQGPSLVLVHGSTADRTRWAKLLPELTRHFTVYAMDRRGRGTSGDGDEYSLEAEFEDVAAVVEAAGEEVFLLGHSFGALCALEVALRVPNLRKLVLYEPAFPTEDTQLYDPAAKRRLEELAEAGDREAMLTAFLREVAQMSEQEVAALKADASWQGRLAAAHTAIRELADGEYVFEPTRFASMDVPTLLLVGGNSPAFLRRPSEVVNHALPNSRIVDLPGQGHAAMNTAPEMFLREVIGFLTQAEVNPAHA